MTSPESISPEFAARLAEKEQARKRTELKRALALFAFALAAVFFASQERLIDNPFATHPDSSVSIEDGPDTSRHTIPTGTER